MPALLNSDQKNLLKAWIAAILWLIVIAIESTAMLSSNNTSRILYPVLHYLFGLDVDAIRARALFPAQRRTRGRLRHSEHSAFRAWRATLPAMSNVNWTLRWSAIAILGTAFVASLDEWHQTFIPSRTGRWQDVVLDTCAGIAAQLLIFLWLKGCRSDGALVH